MWHSWSHHLRIYRIAGAQQSGHFMDRMIEAPKHLRTVMLRAIFYSSPSSPLFAAG